MQLHKFSFPRLTHLEAGQFIKTTLKDLQTGGVKTTTDPNINAYVVKLTADSVLLDKGMLQIQKNQETEAIAALDFARDNTIIMFQRQLSVYELSLVPAQIVAFKAVKIVVNNYKNLTDLNYEAESNGIDNFLADLASADYAAHVTTLTLAPFITNIKTANEAFKLKFSRRNIGISTTEVIDVKAVRKIAFINYSSFADYVLALAKVTTANTYYKDILNIVNQSRSYYSDLLAKRLAEKKPDSEEEAE